METRPKTVGRCISSSTRMNLRLCGEETFMIVYGSGIFRRRRTPHPPFRPRAWPPFFSPPPFRAYVYAFARAARKQPRDSHKKRNHCSSSLQFSTFLREATFIPRGSKFVFRSYDSPGTYRFARVPYELRRGKKKRKKRREGGRGSSLTVLCITITA